MVSGGLDSILAAAYMKELGFDILAVSMEMPFGIPSDKPTDAQRMCEQIGLPLKTESRGQEFFDLVRNPRFGHGKNMNPCIDCRIAMLKRAKRMLAEEKASFIVTGEVLGQRPMSQRRDAMNIIDREADVKGLVLRPLCAAHMTPTAAEEQGLVDRGKMLDISGRSRKPQMAMAARMNIVDYPGPAGGCALTDPIFAKKLSHLFSIKEHTTAQDWNLLCVGRHIVLGPGTKAVVARRDVENSWVMEFGQSAECLLEPVNFPGPAAVIVGPQDEFMRRLVGAIILRYGKAPQEGAAQIRFRTDQGEGLLEVFEPATDDQIVPNLIV